MIAELLVAAALGAPLKGTYVPAPTPTPHGRPPRIECWNPDAFNFATGQTTIGSNNVFCCYEWRGGFMDDTGHWVFLGCVGR